MLTERTTPFWKKWLRTLPLQQARDVLARPVAAVAPLDVATLEDRILFSVTPLVEAGGGEGAAVVEMAVTFAAADLEQACVQAGISGEMGGAQPSIEQEMGYEEPATQETVDDASLVGDMEAESAEADAETDDSSMLGPASDEDSLLENDPAVQHELVVVDAQIDNLEQLLQSLKESAGESRDLDIVFVDRGEDGFAAIDAAISGDTRYDAIHIISHGNDGMQRLGSTWLDQYTVEQRSDELQLWAGKLAEDADVLLYGCDLAANADGEWLVDRLHDITGLDFAASTDSTGSAGRGGDWDLELEIGQIESAELFVTPQSEWEGLLAVYTVTNVNDSGAGSLRQAIVDANANAGTDTIAFNISGSGVHTIDVLSALPQITEAVIIDGTTQSGFAGAPLIELNGAGAGAGVFGINIGAGGAGSTIRGLIVNRFGNSGIAIFGGGSTIVGNYIGTDATGTIDLGNAVDGVEVFSNNNTVGGLTAADRNIISGNNDDGVNIDTGATGNVVIGNYIGTDVTGTLDVGNSDDGVLVENSASGNIIGGTTAAARNVISGNNGDGVELTSSASGNVLSGNYIGLNAAGTGGIGNSGNGVHINGGTGSVVGGTAAGTANTIAYNGNDGVFIASGTGHYVLGNSIHSNVSLAIDLGTDGVTANDAGDADVGANNQQNFAVLTSTNLVSTTQVNVAGTLNSAASSYYRIEFFAGSTQNPTGYGGVGTYLGFANVTTDASGNASFSTTLSASVSLGSYISATVTQSNATFTTFSDTSEFSQNIVASNSAPTLDNTKSPALSAVNEDAGAPSGAVGTLVSQLVDFASPAGQVDNVTDTDTAAVLGIAITAANTTNGTWWYSTDNGANWNALGAVSGASARLLAADANTRVYFQPSANYNGSTADAITFRAWDRTSGTNGGTADTSTNGGSTAFSTATDTASLTVNAVNDPPVITSNGGGATASVSIAENTAAVTTVTSTDVDGPGATYTIVGGNDAALFTIDGSTGALSFVSVRNYEAPTDFGGNNIYDVTVQVSDGTLSDTQAISVTITDVDEFDVGPISDTNAAANAVNENAANGTVVGVTASASDADGTTSAITYSLDDNAGGRFAIGGTTGVVTVADGTLLNREAAAAHNITVRATSADGSFSTQLFSINVNDVDEFDVGAISDSNGAANAVNENAANGTSVGVTASAADADATTSAISYSLDDSAGGRFAIDSSTGVVTVADGTLLDREAAAAHNIMVRATSADGSYSTQSFTINLNDVDEFDTGPVSDANAAANVINENAANGTVVGITALAADADATTNTITYTLDDSAGGRFAIDGTTGVVTVADGTLLDREAAAAHNITVRATSADGSFSTQSFTINLNDVDEFDVGPINDVNGAANAVNENAANGTAVGITALATDADVTTSSVSYALDDDAGGRFAIDSSTGVVTVADGTLLDREAAAAHNITVRATSADGSFSTQLFTINLNDLEEFDTGAISDANAAANAVNENAANGTVVGITALATDADATTNTITYTLDDSAGGRFAIDGTTGVVTVADGTQLDREAATLHGITVRATSADGSFSTQSFTINLNDVDEFDTGAISDTNAAANAVNENAANGTVIGITALAADADATTNTISYTLDDSAGGRFAIDGTTGVVTVADGTLLDREAAASHNVTVRATSADGSFSTQSFTINLNDVDEFDTGAISDTNAAANAVNENAANGTAVGITALATDADATTNIITYALDDTAGGRFAIDSVTGVVTVADGTLLDYEAATSHNVVVRATSADGSFSTQSFTINLVEVNDNAPVVTAGQSFAISENSVNGTVVGSAVATDADTVGSLQNWTIVGGSGATAFAIDAASGQITVADVTQLDFEVTTSFTLQLTVSDGVQTSAVQSVTVNLTNIPGVITLDLDADDSGGAAGADAAASFMEDGGAVTLADADVVVTAFEATIDTLTVTITNRLDGTAESLSADTSGTNITATYNVATGVLTLSGSDSAANYEQVLRSLTYNNASQNPDTTARTVTFVASGGGATSNVATATVSVTAVNDAPVAVGEAFTLSNIDTLTVNPPGLTQNDTDIEGNALTTVLVAGPTNGTLVLNADGSFTYTPDENFTGVDSFTYAVSDGSGMSGPVTVQLTVTARGGPLPPDDPTEEPDDPGDGGGTPSVDDLIEDDDSDPSDGEPDDDSNTPSQPTGPDHRRNRDYGGEETTRGSFSGSDLRPRSRAGEGWDPLESTCRHASLSIL